MYRLALIELHQETNSFSTVPTELKNFESLALHYDEDVHTGGDKHKLQVDGFRKAIKKIGKGKVEFVPIIAAWSHSGGKITAEVFEHFKSHILSRLEGNNLDGIYFSVHGAMGVEDMHDPEGDLLEEIRAIVGNKMPIGVSCDLHANITAKLVDNATFINAYRTNPHRDHNKIGFKSGEMLIRTVFGEINPVMAFQKMPLLKGGGFNIDFIAPMRKIFKAMKRMERDPRVLSVSNFMVHIWIDAPEVGWSCVVVTDNEPKLANELCNDLCNLNWSVKDYPHPAPITAIKAIEIVKKNRWIRPFGTVIISDLSDLVAAGAPGENTHILKALMAESNKLKAYIPLCDADNVRQLDGANLNSEVRVEVGAKLDKVYNEQLTFKGILLYLDESRYGKTAVIVKDKLYLILTSLPCPAFKPSFFTKLGLSLWKADVVVVKNLFPFRLFFWLYNRKTIYVETKGVTNIDVFQLDYKHIPRPIYPLDKIENWN
ncbi:M81 family metallopeptidase [Fulvivirga lutimaris]|uniref:M81 family metallopeptidase n=1 Tax=Fulvivirga lutimaris TaxID=1819566 RepID=UPI0012BB8869|nr:M81 family metallopeptidase [Fulvivirga lutimaris]MTI41203.1 M81 family peptidase [Fulvivirga lutimaris]